MIAAALVGAWAVVRHAVDGWRLLWRLLRTRIEDLDDGEPERTAHWHPCPFGCSDLVVWSPLDRSPLWYVLCRECNREAYLRR